jgi:YD repeat-containing protein
MTTIISGNNLGLSTSSFAVLGSDGGVGDAKQGRSGEQVYVDASNGNLVIQREDDLLVGDGVSIDTVRTYNSQATVDGDNNDNWRIGLYKRIYNITGTINTAGSTVTRTDGDGADTVYTYDATTNRYKNTDGAGAYDTLSYNATTFQWTWTDGQTQHAETYDAKNNGRIMGAADPSGNTLSYLYNGNLLSTVFNSDGDSTYLEYNASSQLLAVHDNLANGTSTHVYYDYDTNGRLWHVKVDLSPNDNSIADGKFYQTTYSYDGTSTRVTGISQTDGSQLTIGYVLSGTTYMVASVTDGLGRVTTFNYMKNKKTLVTDPMQFQTTYMYDGLGQLTSVVAPTVGGVSSTRTFAYDASGNVTSMVDGAGRTTTMTYDANGNQLTVQDALGNTTTRTFDSGNRVLTETTSGTAGILATTRYAYDSSGLLRYVVSGDGRVTRNLYDGEGNRISTIGYTSASYDVSALASSTAISLATLDSWAAATDPSKTTRTDYTYDYRGQRATATAYAAVNPTTGAGIADATASTTTYVYDPTGNLLQTVSPNGTTTNTVYDGLNRAIVVDEAPGSPLERVTINTYDDAGNRTIVVAPNGLQTTYSYDFAGQLFKVAQTDASAANLGTTLYAYDKDGRLRVVTDPTGIRTFSLYDADGNKVGDIDGNGSLTEYQYDGSGRVVNTIQYATAVSTAGLLDAQNNPVDVPISTIRPAVTPYNVALASAGATAVASSSAANYPASSLINGDRKGAVDGANGDWEDTTSGAFPDWVEVDFAGWKSITQVNVYSTQDNVANPVEPTDTMTFSQYGATAFTVQGWDGARWVTLGVVTGNNLVKRAVTFAAFTTNKIRVNINAAASAFSRLAEVEAMGVDAAQPPVPTNMALASAGAIATASSVLSSSFLPSFAIDNDRTAAGWGSGTRGGWADATPGTYPDWLQVAFNGTKTISTVVVYGLQDNYNAPVEPTDTMTASTVNNTAFDVQGWNGTSWVTLASVTGNNLVKRTVHFAAFTTDRIRVVVNGSSNGYSMLAEVEAWGVDAAPAETNVALTGVVSASSTYAPSYPASSLNNNERAGAPWGNYSSWIDATPGVYPDWVEIDFDNAKTIDHVVVYSLQDNYSSPVEPTDTMTFSNYGTTDFDVQALVNGTWTTVASVRGNNLVKRSVSFAAVSTSSIRISVLGTKSSYTYLTEVEAWGYTTQAATNQALATAGAVMTASSTNAQAGTNLAPASLNNGDRTGANYQNGGSWADATSNNYPDWVEADFAGLKSITQTVVYSLQDNPTSPLTPTDTMTSGYAVTNYDVQAWVDGAWTTIASVRGNTHVKSVANFAATITDRIRINILSTPTQFSHMTELEAWGTSLPVVTPPPLSSHVTTTIRDAAGRIVKQVDPAGFVTQTVYDSASRITDIIQYALPIDRNSLPANPAPSDATPPASPLDRHTRNFYDNDGHLVGVLDAEGYLTTYTYDKAGRQVQSYKYANPTAAANRLTGTLAQLIPAAAPTDIVTATIYNGQGQVTATVDGEGYLTENVYDADGNLVRTIRYSTTVSYTAGTTLAALRPVSDPNAQVRAYTYDALDQMVTSTDEEGTITQYAYDKVGNLTSKTVGVGLAEKRTLTTRYDALGRVTGELNGIGSALLTGNQTQAQVDQIFAQYGTTYAYDAAGRRTSATDADGNKTFFYYADDGRLVYTVDATGAVVEHRYNALNQEIATVAYARQLTNLAALTGGLASLAGGQAQLQPDPVNDRVTLIGYDADGNVASTTDALGFKTLYSYDAFGEVTAKSVQIDTTNWLSSAYGYDHRGLLANELDDTIATSRQYDAFGRLIQSTDGNGNVRSYAYDRLGREVLVTGPASITRNQTVYDAFSRVIRTVDLVQNTATTYAYDLTAKTITTTSPEGVIVVTKHDAQGQEVSVTTGTGASARTVTYGYDLNGNLTSTRDGLGDGTQDVYDNANRLLQTANFGTAAGAVNYTYDAVGRVLTRTADVNAHDGLASGLNITTSTYYDAFGDKVLTVDNGAMTTYTWDRKGELTLQVVDITGVAFATQFTYDGRGQTLSVLANSALTTYAYDKLGRRIAQHVDPNALNLTTTYEYDNNGNVVAVTDPNGNRTRRVYDQDDRLIFTIDGAADVTEREYDSKSNVVLEVDYANPIGATQLASLAANPTVAAVRAALTPSASDHVTSTVYDGDGRAIYQLDSTGSLTKRSYDASGNVIEQVTYATSIPGAAATRANLDSLSTLIASPTDNHIRTVYDAASRVVLTVDGAGDVVQNKYDSRNNLIEQITYANAIPAGTPADANSIGAALRPDPAHDEDVHYVYDGLSRLRFTIDGAGGVTESRYDADGNVTEKIGYSTPVTLPGVINESTIAAMVPSVPQYDRHDYLYYDKAGRLDFTVDGLGDVTQEIYDGNGNVKERIHFANRIVGQPPATESAMRTAVSTLADTVHDLHERFRYDGANRLTYSSTPTGAVTLRVYDGDGNVVKTVQYANVITGTDPSQVVPDQYGNDRTTLNFYDGANRLVFTQDPSSAIVENDYDGKGNLVTTRQFDVFNSNLAGYTTASVRTLVSFQSNAKDRIQSNVYDSANRLVYQVDPDSFVKRTDYDGAGRVSGTYDYATVLAAGTSMTQAAIAAAVVTNNQKDEATTYGYDGAGRQVAITDALGKTESYTYDGAGNKLSCTNKLGATWTYGYDAAGRQVSETTPNVDTTTLTLVNGAYQASTATGGLVTTTQYDAMGRVIARIEPTRTTIYRYDALSRQIQTVYPAVGVYNAAADSTGNVTRTEQTVQPSSSVIYNARGDAVVSQDVAGNYSYKAYDLAGRVVYEIDAEGYVTKHDWDAFGDETKVTRYSTRVTGLPGPQELTLEAIASLVNANDPNRRVLTKTYDALGRVRTVDQGAAFFYDTSAQNATTTNAAGAMTTTTQYTWTSYDMLGRVFQTGTQRDAGGAKWDLTTYYYDQAGNKTMEVDSLGYATKYAYDAEGNLTSETEYATAIAGWNAANQVFVNPAPTAPAANANLDRTTNYGYDKLNRKLTETRVNVEYSTASDGTSTRGNLTTTYAYDALGNLTQTTDATGATTFTYYDALGRTTMVMAPTRTDQITGQFFTPLTAFKRDAYGNVVEQIEYARGSAGLDASLIPHGNDADTNNRVSMSVYDVDGHVTESVDATGHSKYFSYDISGHLAKQWETVTQETANKLIQTFSYDKVGHQVDAVEYRLNPSTGQYTPVHNESLYNAFGEVVGQGVNNTTDQTYEYDTMGRVWRARGADGVLTVYLYDFSGSTSAKIASPTVDLGPGSLAAASGINFMWNVVAKTAYVHDLRGREVQDVDITPPPQLAGTNWVVTNYSAQKAMDIAFLALDAQAAGTQTTWATGTVTRGPGSMATFADNQGHVTTFDIEKGALVAVKLSDSMRVALQAQFNAIFAQGQGNFIPTNLATWRQMEIDFDNYFTDPQFGNGRVIQWMGGTLQQSAPGVALFTDANHNTFTFTAAAGLLPILNQFSGNSIIRLGWERDYGIRFVGDGGEQMDPIVVGFGTPSGGVPSTETIGSEGSSTQIDWSANSVSLTWGDIGFLGDGDVQVQVYYTDSSYDPSSGTTSQGTSGRTQTVVLSSVAGAHGATLTWQDDHFANGGVWSVDRAVVSKKDVNGNWQVVLDQQNGQGAANQIPSLFSVAASPDPAVQVQVQMATDSLPWTTVTGINFGNRIVYQNLPVSGSTVYYQVSTLQNGLATLRSSGTIAAQVPVLAPIPATNQPSINTATQTITWGAATKAFDPNAPAQHFSIRQEYYGIIPNGTAYLTYRTVATFLQNFMQSTTIPVGYSQYWAGGTIYKSLNNSATFVYNGKTYTFGLNETLQEIVSRSPGIRAAVEATYGSMFQLDPNGYYASNDPGTGALQMEISFDEFFDNKTGNYPVGVVISNWAGGTLTKNADGTATFRYAGEPDYVFRKSDGPYKIIDQNAHIRQQWANEYHITLSQSQWKEISDPGGQSTSASIANLGPGTYQYELIYDRGLLPYAHATGNFTVGEQAINGGYSFTAYSTTSFRNSVGDGLANLRYDTALWFTYPPGTARSWIGGGMLILAKTGNAYFAPATATSPQGAYTFRNNVQAVINDPSYDAGLIRQGWQSEFGPSYDTHYIPSPQWIWNEVVADTAQFFWDNTDFPVGTQLNWYGGTLWKYNATSAMYIQPNGQYYYFNSSTDPAAMADDNAYIRNGWASDPGFAGLSFTPTQAPMLDLSNDTSLFFNDNTDYPQGYVQTWFQGTSSQGTLIKGVNGSGVAYYIPGYPYIMGISAGPYPAGSGQPFEFNASMDVLTIAQTNSDIMAGWEQQYSMFGLEFGWAPTGTVTHDALTYGMNADANPVSTPISLSLTGPAYSPVVATSSLAPATGDSIVVTKTLDRWGNVLTQTDPRNGNWLTQYTYNASNQVIQEDQMQGAQGALVARGTAYDEHGNAITTADTTKTYYDQLGRAVAVVDANGNVNGAVYDAGGELIQQVQADRNAATGQLARTLYEYDLFGDQILMQDTLGNRTSYGYDKMGRLTTVTHAATDVYAGTDADSHIVGTSGRIETYDYDEAGRRIRVTNGDGGAQAAAEAIRYEYDEHGNLVKTTQPISPTLSAITTDTYDVHNNKVTEVDANGILSTWSYDAYGHVQSHRDLSGDTTTYRYDWSGELVEETKPAGVNPARHLAFQYDLLGRQIRIDDSASGSSTIYAYDKAGNKVEEQFTQGGVVYQDNRLSYDSLGRLSEVVDSRHHVWIKYDAVGNRRDVLTNYYADDNTNTVQKVDNWYTYDSMNRMLIENGYMFAGTIGENSTQGIVHTYDTQGNKLSDTQWGTTYPNLTSGNDGPQGWVTTNYYYDSENRLKRAAYGTDVADIDAYQNPDNTTDIRHYDFAGRLEAEITYNLSKINSQSAPGGDDHADTVHNDYDLSGRLVEQTDIDYKGGLRFQDKYTFDNVGNLSSAFLHNRKPSGGPGFIDSTTTYGYIYKDDTYHETSETLSGGASGSTTLTYDANGHVATIVDSNTPANNRSFVNDVAGAVLARADGTSAPVASVSPGAPDTRVEHMLVVDEQTVGLSAKAYVTNAGTTPPQEAAVSRFDFGAQSVSSLGDAPGHYVVTGADADGGLKSLQRIAQTIYGDSTLWYVIAEANGLSSNSDMKAGSVLLIPSSVTTSKNDVRTFKPWDPSVIKGSTTPSLPKPTGADQGCGTMGTIVMAIVAVAATVITAGAAAVALAGEGSALAAEGVIAAGGDVLAGTSGLAFGDAVIAGAAGGAAGSIASQAVGIAIGNQNSFSLKSVAEGLVGGGLAAGLAGLDIAGSAAKALDIPAINPSAAMAVNAGVSNAVTQGVMVATGLQKSFNWASVAASAVAAPLAKELGGEVTKDLTSVLGPTAGMVGQYAQGLFSGSLTRVASNGRVDFGQVAADAFGNVLGQSFVQGGPNPTNAAPQMVDANTRASQTNAPNPVADAVYQQLVSDFSDVSTQAVPGPAYADMYAMDADRLARDVRPVDEAPLRPLLVDPRTGKPSFAFTSWVESDAEQALFGASLMNRPPDTGSSSSFYISPGGAAFGNPRLGSMRSAPLEPDMDGVFEHLDDVEEGANRAGNAALLARSSIAGAAKVPALSILERAAPLWTYRQYEVGAADSLEDAANLFRPTAASAQSLTAAASKYGGTLRGLYFVGVAANIVDESIYVVRSPEGLTAGTVGAAVTNVVGDTSASMGGGAIGAALGLLGGPAAPITVPLFAALFGFGGHYSWDRWAKPFYREVWTGNPNPGH